MNRVCARQSRRGFSLLEALIACLIMAVVLMGMLDVRNNSIRWFTLSGDQYTAAWLAEMKMNELMSERLPDPSKEDTYSDADNGNFGEYDERVNSLNRTYNQKWTDRLYFEQFTYEWKKELIFVGQDFSGLQTDLEAWEPELDSYGQPTGDDPRTKPMARVVRIALVVKRPLARGVTADGEDEPEDQWDKRRTLRLVSYVDPATLFGGKAAATDPAPTPNPTPNPNPNPNPSG